MGIFRGEGGTGDATTDAVASQVAIDAQTASTKANEAATSATNASTSASEASTSATNAATSATTATTKASEASTSATNAASSATSAASSATTATTKASEASTSATNAASSATTATTKASEASTSATNAASSATTATTKASEASTSASNASSSATAAASSATAAANSATAAASSATAAENAKEAIDGLYLGVATSNPTVDGNGNAVTAGDWYFNTSDSTTRIYDGSAWNTVNPDLVGDSSPQLGGNLDLNSRDITGTGNVNITGNISLSGTVDGRDVATDGTKLDGIEASADVTDTANVTAAGALMDSEVTNLAQVKAFDSSDYATAAQGSTADSALQNVVEDTTPQLGGNLDLNGNNITGTGNIDVTGTVTADGLTVNSGTSDTVATFQSTDQFADLALTDSGGTCFIRQSNGSLILEADRANASASSAALIKVDGSEAMRITSSGNVGIGTSSPAEELHISSSVPKIQIQDSDGTNQYGQFYHSAGSTVIQARNNTSDGTIIFQKYDGTTTDETMRIDSSGNLLVGKTAAGTSNVGAELRPQGYIFGTGDGINPLRLNRKTSDGMIADFQKDGTSVGLVASKDGDMVIGTGDTGFRFNDASDAIYPANASTQSARHNAIDLGTSNYRWKDLYLSGDVYAANIKGQNDTNTKIEFLGSDVTRFVQGGSEAMRINSSGNVGIGTSSPAQLLHLSTSAADARIRTDGSSGTMYLGQSTFADLWSSANTSMRFATNNTERMRIDSSGNIGIGTSSPAHELHIDSSSDSSSLRLTNSTGTSGFDLFTSGVTGYLYNRNNGSIRIGTNNAERVRIDSSGNVGIGTTTPGNKLHVRTDTNATGITIQRESTAEGTSAELGFLTSTNDAGDANLWIRGYRGSSFGTSYMTLGTNNLERVRLDSTGALFLGKTAAALNTAGLEVDSSGRTRITRDGNTPVEINRKTNDGSMITFNRDGSIVGKIGVSSSDNLTIGGTAADHAGLLFGTHAIYPREADSLANGTIAFGDSSFRFKDIYSNGLDINSSASNGFNIVATDTAPDTSFNAMRLDYNISGSGATTNDRSHIGLNIDVDSSATGGDTSDEHRIYGVHTAVTASGDSDLIYGNYSITRADNFGSSNQVTNIRSTVGLSQAHQDAGTVSNNIGVYGQGTNLSSGSGIVTHTYGLYGLALAQSTSSQSSTGYSAVFGIAQVADANTSDISQLNGVRAEIQLDNKTSSAVTISNAYVVRAEYDENDSDDASYTVTNGYLFYGNYSGTQPTNAYGVYITDAVRNYFGGYITTSDGSVSSPSYSFNGDTNTGMFSPADHTLGWATNGAEEMRLTSGGDLHVDGNIIAYSTTISDRRLKSDITNISNALDKVGQINGVTFVRDHNGEKAAGVVAQEIMEVLPEAVKSQALPLQTGEQDQEYYVVEYDAVTGLLVEAVKELKARVEALENS